MARDRDSVSDMARTPPTAATVQDEVGERIADRQKDEAFQQKLRESIEQQRRALERLAT